MFYWVNQGKTYKEEKEGGYLWAPVTNSNGKSFFHWTNMTKLKSNDFVFNYRKGFLVGYCIVQSNGYLNPQPEEFNVDVEWHDEGYMADALYFQLPEPIPLVRVFDEIAHYLPSKYSPLNVVDKDGQTIVRANQGYLYELNEQIGERLISFFGIGYDHSGDVTDANAEKVPDYIPPDSTSRRGLVTSRIGQGQYRRRILRRWGYKCAVTGSAIKEVLIASHIVPWRESTDAERLDIDNGILLSPVYDALFDRHFISFNDDGNIILSKAISKEGYTAFGIDGNERIEGLTERNIAYLKRHRDRLIVI